MGISTRYYTVYGVKINDYDEDLSEELYGAGEGDLYQVIENNEHLDIIMDGMGGDYMVIGKVLFDSGDLRWNEIEDTFVEIDLDALPELKEAVTQEMKNLLPAFVHYLDGDWKIMTFMHLS